MTTPPPKSYRRRNFFVKQGFQSRFALYPIAFFALFLLGAAIYLGAYLKETLEFHLYLPHSRLQNPWEEVLPVLSRTAAWGGGAFLVALACWGWRRFGRLRSDLNRVAGWMFGLTRGGEVEAPPDLRDREVETLGRGLHTAVESFASWDRTVDDRAQALTDRVAALGAADEAERAVHLGEVRSAFSKLWDVINAVCVNEELS